MQPTLINAAVASSLLTLAAATERATAAMIAYEPFNGPAGELVEQVTGGSGLTGAWTGVTGVDVIHNNNTGVTYTDTNGHALMQSGNALNVGEAKQGAITAVQRNFTDPVPDSGTYYVSAMFYIGAVKTGNYFGIGLPGTTGNIVLGQDSTRWAIYNWDNDSYGAGTAIGAQRAFLVAKITKGSPSGTESAVTLWVNPVLGDEISSGTGATGIINNNVAWTGISTPVYTGVSGNPGNWVADVRVGTTFADVTPFTAIPEPAALAFLGLAGLFLAGRRQRR